MRTAQAIESEAQTVLGQLGQLEWSYMNQKAALAARLQSLQVEQTAIAAQSPAAVVERHRGLLDALAEIGADKLREIAAAATNKASEEA